MVSIREFLLLSQLWEILPPPITSLEEIALLELAGLPYCACKGWQNCYKLLWKTVICTVSCSNSVKRKVMPVEETVRGKEGWRRYSPKAWMKVVAPFDIFWGFRTTYCTLYRHILTAYVIYFPCSGK